MSDLLRQILARKQENAGRRSERYTAKRTGARLRPASGAMPSAKGDMELRGEMTFLLEAKSTQADRGALELEHLRKIRREARELGQHPGLTFTFTDSQGRPRQGGTFVVLDEATFQELLERAQR